jgi:hypothetical protein
MSYDLLTIKKSKAAAPMDDDEEALYKSVGELFQCKQEGLF